MRVEIKPVNKTHYKEQGEIIKVMEKPLPSPVDDVKSVCYVVKLDDWDLLYEFWEYELKEIEDTDEDDSEEKEESMEEESKAMKEAKEEFPLGTKVLLMDNCKELAIIIPESSRVATVTGYSEGGIIQVTDVNNHTWWTNGRCIQKIDDHYDGDVEPIELMEAQMNKDEFIGFLKGNIIKYASRLGKKDDPVKEADKIITYAEWLKEFLTDGKITL